MLVVVVVYVASKLSFSQGKAQLLCTDLGWQELQHRDEQELPGRIVHLHPPQLQYE